MMRKGAGRGTGKGYKNLRSFPRDASIHSQSAKGMKQPQKIPKTMKTKTEINKTYEVSQTKFNELKEKISQEFPDYLNKIDKRGMVKIYQTYGLEPVEFIFSTKEINLFREMSVNQRKQINDAFLNKIKGLESKNIKLIKYKGRHDRPVVVAVDKDYFEQFPTEIEEQIIKDKTSVAGFFVEQIKGDKNWKKKLEKKKVSCGGDL